MKLKSITLKNSRLFSDLKCSLHPDLTVFVAPNGGGKTSILDAIKVTFDAYLGAFPTAIGRGIKLSDVRQVLTKDELGRMEPVFPVQVTAIGEIEAGHGEVSWSRTLNTSKSGTTIKDAKALANYGRHLQEKATDPTDSTNWPLLAYYGTGRLWNQKKLTSKKQIASGFHTRAAGYIDCMEPASSYKLFLDWFYYAYKFHVRSKIRYMEAHPKATSEEIMGVISVFTPLLYAVQGAVNTVLAPSGWKKIWYSDTLNDAIASHDQFGTLAVSQLSDGIRTAIGLVADMAFRAVQLNPHLDAQAALETQGVVLIDEVDMHLHPEWQQLILANLNQAFPKIQFIVTTHSPQVLTTLRKENIRILACDEDGKWTANEPVMSPLAHESGDALAMIMGTHPRPEISDIMPDLYAYEHLARAGRADSEEARQIKARLDAIGYEFNEADQALFTFLAAKAEKSKAETP